MKRHEHRNVVVMDHVLVSHKLAILRDEKTSSKEFRELIEELSILVGYEALRDLPAVFIDVKTPLEFCKQQIVAPESVAIVPILRAGLGMVDGVLKLLPTAKVGHIGLYRDHDTLKPNSYYFKFPNNMDKKIGILLDPMLATGGSVNAAIDILKKTGCRKIKLMCVIAAPEGVAAVTKAHPDVQIYIAGLDRCLNEKGYILPGLGDAGDRIYSGQS